MYICFCFLGLLTTYGGASFVRNTIGRKVLLASIEKKGQGHIEREKCLFHFQSWSCEGCYFGDWRHICIFHPTVSPDHFYHIHPHPHSVKYWDITLRKYQLHCLQYHMPIRTHLLLLVGVQQRETGTETERDKRERRHLGEVAL